MCPLPSPPIALLVPSLAQSPNGWLAILATLIATPYALWATRTFLIGRESKRVGVGVGIMALLFTALLVAAVSFNVHVVATSILSGWYSSVAARLPLPGCSLKQINTEYAKAILQVRPAEMAYEASFGFAVILLVAFAGFVVREARQRHVD